MQTISVIIPAHNEVNVIDACLAAVLGQQGESEISAVVVANGCTDDTAKRARKWIERFENAGHLLVVAEVEIAGKIAALNKGDELAADGHRVYLDADITLSDHALDDIVETFSSCSAIGVCCPACRIRPAKSFVTRSYARIWSMLPYFQQGVIGCGVYAVSKAGRRRWGEFPPIIADDKFVRLQFGPAERGVAASSTFTITLPEGFRELVKVRTRWSAGNRELDVVYPSLTAPDERRYGATFVLIARRPALWIASLVFLAVYLTAEIRAARRWKLGAAVWERAGSARAD